MPLTRDQIEERIFAQHPRPWWVHNRPLKPGLRKVIEIKDADGKTVIPWLGFDDTAGDRPRTEHLRLARLIVWLANETGQF